MSSSLGRVAEPVVRVAVTVTFLVLDSAPAGVTPAWPEGVRVVRVPECTVARYRSLYHGVGAAHVWWLRRAMADRELAALLRRPQVRIHVLQVARDGVWVDAGFHELDGSAAPVANLSYFGLLPHALGCGLGGRLLRDAIDRAFLDGARSLTVNTCNADHPRAMATYVAAGFRPTRSVKEVWSVPRRLGLAIPLRLLA